MLVLGIETSCDETSAAVVDGSYHVRSNVVSSQGEHAPYGGVVPEIASRAHVRAILPVVDAALREAGCPLDMMDAVAVTRGPGLVGSLIVGVAAAKAIALARGLPLVGVHHLEGHIFANRVDTDAEPPFLTLLVSGGHTELLLTREWGQYAVLGRTRDDAAGEAFDKVAKLLRLLPPQGVVAGGRAVAAAAAGGRPDAVALPRAMLGADSLDFSFSGLKTAVLNEVRGAARDGTALSVPDLAASFQSAVVDVLVRKTLTAVEQTGIASVALAGGVAANQLLRAEMRAALESCGGRLYCPSPALCTDNAAMIGAAGVFHLAAGTVSGLELDPVARLALG